MTELAGVEVLDGTVDPWADEDLLAYALSPSWETSPAWRARSTRLSPVLFAYTYLSHHMHSPSTQHVMSLAAHHLELHRIGQSWIRPGAHRDAIIAPREAAKSTWSCLVLPLWALAHGHRRFAVMYSDTWPQIALHFDTLRAELSGNDLLLTDFPALRPRKGKGGNTANRYVTAGGSAFAAKGMEERTLGIKIGAARPDLIIGDDLEPPGETYSPALKAKRLGLWRNAVLPVSTDAAVLMAGTVVMYGSVMHELVIAANGGPRARWIDEDGVRARHFPAITVDPQTGAEASFWSRRHSLVELQAMRGTQNFALNYDGRPALPGGGHWTEDMFRFPDEPVLVDNRVISIDTAVRGESMDRKHDYTAVSVVGTMAGRPDVAVVEYCQGRRVTGAQLREWIHELCRRAPGIREVIIEVNQGGDLWRQILAPMPPAVKLTTYSATVRKEARTLALHDHYVRGRVLHQYRHGELENLLMRWPKVEHDDLIDTVSAGVEHVFRAAAA